MRYCDLEAEVYRLLRTDGKARARLLVAQSLSGLSPDEAVMGQLLLANVELVCSHLVVHTPRERVRYALRTGSLDSVACCKAHLLGAHIARATEDFGSWQEHIEGMQAALVGAPEWEGRWLRSVALFREAGGEMDAAEQSQHTCLTWHREHAGPYDERDRLCYIGMTFNDLARLHVLRGDADGADALHWEARALIPVDAPQHVYALLCGVRIALARQDVVNVSGRLDAVEEQLRAYPNAHAATQAQQLRLAFYQQTEQHGDAGRLLAKMQRAAYLSRDLPTLRQLESAAELIV